MIVLVTLRVFAVIGQMNFKQHRTHGLNRFVKPRVLCVLMVSQMNFKSHKNTEHIAICYINLHDMSCRGDLQEFQIPVPPIKHCLFHNYRNILLFLCTSPNNVYSPIIYSLLYLRQPDSKKDN